MREILGYGIGDTVAHKEYGLGRVEDIVKTKKGFVVEVKFINPKCGTKALFADHVKLERVPVD